MGERAAHPPARTERPLTARCYGWVWAAVPIAVGVVAFTHRTSLEQAAGLVVRARLRWLLPAVLAIGGVYLCRAYVYGVPLRLLRFAVPRSFLWSTGLVATSLHQLIPTGGASGYVFLTWALHQRGVPGGQASLIALIDTLSYAVAAATLVIASLAYLAVAKATGLGRLALGLVPGMGIAAIAAGVYVLQRRRQRFVPLVLGLKSRLARRLGRRWPDEPLREFLSDYYAAKDVVGRSRGAFAGMVGFQYLALGCDIAALYAVFLALGAGPDPWTTVMGFVLSMAGVSVVAMPGGGGSFEVIMAWFFAAHGLGASQAIAAALLYRVVAFWVPVPVSLVVLYRLRRHAENTRAPKEARAATPSTS